MVLGNLNCKSWHWRFSYHLGNMGSLLTLCWFREIQKSSSGLIRDYSLDPATFKLLVTNFGEFTTDALSTVPNAVCAKSYSR